MVQRPLIVRSIGDQTETPELQAGVFAAGGGTYQARRYVAARARYASPWQVFGSSE